MLVLTRYVNGQIYIGDHITITVMDIDRGKVRIGIEAPSNVPINRAELGRPVVKESVQATTRQEAVPPGKEAAK